MAELQTGALNYNVTTTPKNKHDVLFNHLEGSHVHLEIMID